VWEDVQTVLHHDPAARRALEVLLVYPGLHAVWLHRISHALWRRGWVLPPRVLSHLARAWTGIEIHPGARLGRRVFIDHGMGIVVGETAQVGDDCLLYAGAVLGGTSLERTERHPRLGAGVVVGTHACILGPIHVGDGAKVGSNSVVVRDVPAGSTVVGVPGRLGSRRSARHLDHADLPDPVAGLLQELMQKVEVLQARVATLEGGPVGLGGRADEMDAFREDLEAGAEGEG
jgi:serine O-acetyltransferase